MLNVHIWIDGDSCPTRVREYIFGYAKQRNLQVSFVSNKKILDQEHEQFQICVSSSEKDAADNYILEHAEIYDIIVTRDIPFAARAVEKHISTVNDRGFIFTNENIAQKLRDRDYDLSLAEIGFESPREKNYGKKEFANFVACFEKEMKRLIREKAMEKISSYKPR